MSVYPLPSAEPRKPPLAALVADLSGEASSPVGWDEFLSAVEPAPASPSSEEDLEAVSSPVGWDEFLSAVEPAPNAPVAPAPTPETFGRAVAERWSETADFLAPAAKVADDFVRSLASGMTLGFADEIAAGADTLAAELGERFGFEITPKTYSENLAEEAARDADIALPVRVGGELLGAVTTGGLTAKALMGGVSSIPLLSRIPASTTRLGQAGRGAAIGAAEGAIAGAGHAAPGERSEGAVSGALFGAPLGAVAPAATDLATRTLGPLTESAGRSLGRLTGREVAKNIPAERLGGLASTPGAVVADVSDQARAQGTAALGRLPPSAEDVASSLAARSAARPEALRSALTETGDAVLPSRVASPDEVASRMASRAEDLLIQMGKAADQAADPDYIVGRDALERLYGNASMRDALRKIGVTTFGEGKESFIPGDLPTLNKLFRELGDRMSTNLSAGNVSAARTNKELAESLVDVIGNQNQGYAQYANEWLTNQGTRAALDFGEEFLSPKVSNESLSRALNSLDDLQRDYFNAGMARALVDRITKQAKTPEDVRRVFNNSRVKERLRLVFASRPREQADFLSNLSASMREAIEEGGFGVGQRVPPTSRQVEDELGSILDILGRQADQIGTEQAAQRAYSAGSSGAVPSQALSTDNLLLRGREWLARGGRQAEADVLVNQLLGSPAPSPAQLMSLPPSGQTLIGGTAGAIGLLEGLRDRPPYTPGLLGE